MKDQIKELAKEAGFCFWEDEPWKPHGATIDWGASYDKELQKFAELIIRECLVLADQFEIDVNRSGLVSAIERHFGIEE